MVFLVWQVHVYIDSTRKDAMKQVDVMVDKCWKPKENVSNHKHYFTLKTVTTLRF